MNVYVCGSRYFSNHRAVWTNLYEVDAHYGITSLLYGDLRGAAKLAKEWATHRGLRRRAFPADREHFGVAGELFRNRQVLLEGQPGLVVAFPLTELAKSPNTQDMVNQALWANVDTMVIEGDTRWELIN